MRSYPKAVIAISLLAFFPTLLHAQYYPPVEPLQLHKPGITVRMERYEGLSPDMQFGAMMAYAADRNGFLWCQTKRGLARFDGYELTLYPEDFTDTTGAFRTNLNALAVDGAGFVWGATTQVGLQRFDPATGKSRWYQGRRDDTTSIGTGASRLLVASDGTLWAGAGYGLARYDMARDAFVRYPFPPEYNIVFPTDYRVVWDYPVTSICEIGPSLWVALAVHIPEGFEGGGLLELNRQTGRWKQYLHDARTGSGPSHNIVRSVTADGEGRLWMGTRAGLDRYDPRTGAWVHFSVTKDSVWASKDGSFPPPSTRVWVVAKDDLGGVWLATDTAGVYRIDPATGAFLHFQSGADVNSIPVNFVNKLIVLRSNVDVRQSLSPGPPANCMVLIPIGAEGTYRGIAYRNPSTSVMIPPRPGRFGHLISQFAFGPPGKIWVLRHNGFMGLMDLDRQNVKWYTGGPIGMLRMARLRDNTILATTLHYYVAFILDSTRSTFARLLPQLSISNFLEENDSLVWLGCRNPGGVSSLAAWNRRTGTYIPYPRQDPDSASHRDEYVTCMSNDRRGGLWYGTAGGGLIRFDLRQRQYRRYAAIAGSDSTLSANPVNALLPDSAGNLWVGTSAGLNVMDCNRGIFDHVHFASEQSGELSISDMADDGEGHLWIAAGNHGALCFTKSTRTFRRLTPPQPFYGAMPVCVVVDPRSRTVTFGGALGLYSFPIDDPPPSSPPPPVVLTSFKVFEKPYPLGAEIWSLKSITLPASASFFSLTFAALDYINSAKNRYAYRLEGVDPAWVESGTRRYVSYTNLDPGTYQFRVRGANSEGIWNMEGASLEIVILPPWYRTTWAYAAYVLAIGTLLYLVRRYDRKRIALKHSLEMKSFEAEKMREVDQMKSHFFANISHEFRTPLTLILGPLEQFTDRFKHDEQLLSTIATMRRNGLRLLQLINQLLDLSRVDAGRMTVQVRPLELVALSRSLVMSFISLADRKRIQLIFDPEEEEIVGYTDRDKFEKILTNLLSNAFKFTGEEGEIKVVVRTANGGENSPADTDAPETRHSVAGPPRGTNSLSRRIELIVSDTGIGIDAEHLAKVFDRFYQVKSSDMQDPGGTGIGLSLAKELAGMLRGEITAESTPGHGSSFFVRLPIAKEAWRPEEIATDELLTEREAPVLAHAGSTPDLVSEEARTGDRESLREPGKPVVLIVEDSADVRSYVRGFLAKHYTVEEAENGKIGLEKARGMAIDLVISDIMMPVMDGVQFCKELKGDELTNHIPVILLTARATTEGKLEGLDIGADDYVVKPFDARELMARAKNLIDTRRKLREKYHRQVTLGPANITVGSADEQFLKRFTEYVAQHVSEAEYDTEALAHDMCMSRMQLNRKLHALTGHPTHELVRQYRLQRAAQLLQNHAGNVSQIAFESGFNSLSHFTRAFREQFGALPSEYRRSAPEKSDKQNGARA
jgi:signal transduction histidine kinase/DNA-binding response OmpR family regulator/ligand-binding sensor domain-containing protein